MSLRSLLLPLLLVCAAFAAAQSADIETEERFLERLKIPADAKVQYRDEKGAPLTYAEFAPRFAVTRNMAMTRERATKTVTIALPDPEKKNAAKVAALKFKEGEALPDFRLAFLDGRPFDKTAFAGKPLLLSFFYSTCDPCIRDVPFLNDFAATNKDVQVAAVTFDKAEVAAAFRDQYKLAVPMAAEARPFINELGVKAYPTFVLLDENGALLGVKAGLSTAGERNFITEWATGLLQKRRAG